MGRIVSNNGDGNECRIVMITTGGFTGGDLDGQKGRQVNAGAYNVHDRVGRPLAEGEAPEKFVDFVEQVTDDMFNVCAIAIADIAKMAKNGMTTDQIYIDTLVNLENMPKMVVTNMLKSMLIGHVGI